MYEKGEDGSNSEKKEEILYFFHGPFSSLLLQKSGILPPHTMAKFLTHVLTIKRRREEVPITLLLLLSVFSLLLSARPLSSSSNTTFDIPSSSLLQPPPPPNGDATAEAGTRDSFKNTFALWYSSFNGQYFIFPYVMSNAFQKKIQSAYQCSRALEVPKPNSPLLNTHPPHTTKRASI